MTSWRGLSVSFQIDLISSYIIHAAIPLFVLEVSERPEEKHYYKPSSSMALQL